MEVRAPQRATTTVMGGSGQSAAGRSTISSHSHPYRVMTSHCRISSRWLKGRQPTGADVLKLPAAVLTLIFIQVI